jgi:WD40 repeat protein
MRPDGNLLEVRDVETGKALWRKPGYGCIPWRFSPDDRLAAAFDDGAVDVIDTSTGNTTGTVTLPSQRATFLWWSPDGKRLVVDSSRQLRFEIRRP